MSSPRLLPFLLVVLLNCGGLRAETPEAAARKVTLTMNLTDVTPAAAAHFVEVLTNVKVQFQGLPGDRTLVSVTFENASADAALRRIAELANLDLTYQADGAHLNPKK